MKMRLLMLFLYVTLRHTPKGALVSCWSCSAGYHSMYVESEQRRRSTTQQKTSGRELCFLLSFDSGLLHTHSLSLLLLPNMENNRDSSIDEE